MLLGLLLVLALIYPIFFFGWDGLEIDSCLDAGGRWNEELRLCEGARHG